MLGLNLRFGLPYYAAGAAILAATLSVPTSAVACGGLFCASATPVNQVAERIVFSKNAGGTVTAVIEVQYEGPAHEFAWVLPVPAGDISVGVGSTVALDALQRQSNPQYFLQPQFDDCSFAGQGVGGAGGVPAASGGAFAAGGGPSAAGGGSSVQVVASSTVGPYDYAQLAVNPGAQDPATAVVSWLEMNGYDITGIGTDLLRGYLADGMNLLAFKLSKGSTTGSVRPVLITYPGTEPMIPIKPTAVAANDDMGVMVWVLGENRAVPSNYRHLEVNEAYINWFNPGLNYNDVIVAAADEAGGQGFVTEQAGPAGIYAEAVFGQFEADRWAQLENGQFATILEFIEAATATLGAEEGFLDALSEDGVLPLRAGATAEQFVNCPRCYFEVDVPVRTRAYPETAYVAATDPMKDFSAGKVLDALDRLVVGPKRRMRELFDQNPWVTRFYTTLSPSEMTKDPIFNFNSKLEAYSNVHQAIQRIHCQGDWHVDLPQGGSLAGVGQTWPLTPGQEKDLPLNLRVLQLTQNTEKIVTDSTMTVLKFLAAQSGEAVTDPSPPLIDAKPMTPGEVDPGKPNVKPEDPPEVGNGNPRTGDASDGRPKNSASDGGCSVGLGGSSGGAWWLLGLAAALTLTRRRSTEEDPANFQSADRQWSTTAVSLAHMDAQQFPRRVFGVADFATSGHESAAPGALTQLASELERVEGPSLGAALARGRILWTSVLGADGFLERARGKKCMSFRALASRATRGMSCSSLWRAVAIYELSLSFPELTEYTHVGVGHLSVLLGLPRAQQIELLRAAERNRWTRRKLQALAREFHLKGVTLSPSRCRQPSMGRLGHPGSVHVRAVDRPADCERRSG